jgi:CBS domain-containing protein
VAMNVDPATTDVSEVMTPNPTCVKLADSAMDALMVMVENRFRHLPVVDGEGSVVGLLDIAKCLNDAITKLERSAVKNSSVADDAVRQAVSQQGASGAQAAALHALLGSLMSQAFGNKTTPTLRSLLAGKPTTIVRPNASIRAAGMVMTEHRKAALIVDAEGHLAGIFTFKDMMSRAVAKELPLDSTEVSDVMTPSPEFVSPDITVLEALQMMHDNKFLTLPVCEDDGRVVGIVDVMDVIHACGGVDGWRSMFSNAMDIDDDVSEHNSAAPSRISATPSRISATPSRIFTVPRGKVPDIKVVPETPFVSSFPNNIPSTLEFEGSMGDDGSTLDDRGASKILMADEMSVSGSGIAVFKVSDLSGRTHRVRCDLFADELLEGVSKKLGIALACLQLQFVDDEGDTVIITSDDDVVEAWTLARSAGAKVAKVTALTIKSESPFANPAVLGGAGVVGVFVLLGVAFVLLRVKKA